MKVSFCLNFLMAALVIIIFLQTNAASSYEKNEKEELEQIDPMKLQYMVKKIRQTIKLLEQSKEIPICLLIKQEKQRLSMTRYGLFQSNMELLRETLKFYRTNNRNDPVLLHVARDVHIGRRLVRSMQQLDGLAVKKRSNELHLMKIPCVLMTTKLSGEKILLRDFMLRLYNDLLVTLQ